MAVSLSRWIVTSPYDWWVDLVTREFSFLSDAGFRLAKIHIHQEGNFVRYRGRRYDLAIIYEPESTRQLDAILVDMSGAEPRSIPLEKLILEADPGVVLPPKQPLDRRTVSRNVKFWSDGARRILGTIS